MNTDIRLSVDFWSHPKTVKLKRKLGLEGPVALQILWTWAAKNRPNGDLSGMDDEDIEIAAGWETPDFLPGGGDPIPDFVPTLVELRWLDKTETGYKLHDWGDENAYAANAQNRGDRARFNRMASTYPDIYKTLVSKGMETITRSEYQRLVKEYNETHKCESDNETLTTVNEPLTNRSTDNQQPLTVGQLHAPCSMLHTPCLDTTPPPPSEGGGCAGETDADFEKFWAVYPRRIEKKTAIKAYKTLVKQGAKPEDVARAASEYRSATIKQGTPPDKIKYPATFLHDGRWEDWLPPNGAAYLEAQRQPQVQTRGRDSPSPMTATFQEALAQLRRRHGIDVMGGAEYAGTGLAAVSGGNA